MPGEETATLLLDDPRATRPVTLFEVRSGGAGVR
jgi:hypothetical protein